MKPKLTLLHSVFLLFLSSSLFAQSGGLTVKKKPVEQEEYQEYLRQKRQRSVNGSMQAEQQRSLINCASGLGANIGFELGNYSGWTIQTGINVNSDYDSVINAGPAIYTKDLVTGGTDVYTGFSCLSPFTG